MPRSRPSSFSAKAEVESRQSRDCLEGSLRGMFKPSQEGSTVTIVIITVLSVLFIGTAVFAISSYSQGQDYKNNSDKKAAEAVESAKEQQQNELERKFDEEAKKPNTTYKGPVSYGSVAFDYPKTWSAYVSEGESELINGYFHPQIVPGTDSDTAFALRVELVNSPYAQTVEQYESDISSGNLKARAYVPPKMVDTANVQPGLLYEGDLGDGQTAKNGAMLVIQVRDKTLKVYTESANFMGDFNNIVLPSLTFSP